MSALRIIYTKQYFDFRSVKIKKFVSVWRIQRNGETQIAIGTTISSVRASLLKKVKTYLIIKKCKIWQRLINQFKNRFIASLFKVLIMETIPTKNVKMGTLN